MQLSEIESAVKCYLEKYPNSQIEILIGQKDIDEHIPIQYPQSFTGMLNELSDINVPPIRQIYHSQDYSNNTQNTLYLCYEKQDDIYCCQYCGVICGLEMKVQYNPSCEYNCCDKCVQEVDNMVADKRKHNELLCDKVEKFN